MKLRGIANVRDNEDVSETYCSSYVGLAFDGSAVHITLGSLRYIPAKVGDQPGNDEIPTIFVSTRLAISQEAFVNLLHEGNKFIKQLSGAREAYEAIEKARGQISQ